MTENPYASGSAAPNAPQRTGAHGRLIWLGVVCFVLSGLCFVATVVGMVMSFNSVANAGGTAKASDLAHSVSLALIPSFAAVPLGVLGIILLVLGLATRRGGASR